MNKITEARVKSLIKQENIMYVRDSFYPKGNSTMTICILQLENGYEVIGTSSCVDPVNFDKETGASIAYQNALDRVYELEGYLLKQKIWDGNL